jgi:hypothetical protein
VSAVQAARVLWSGGGGAGAPSRLRRARHRLRTLGSEHPTVYLPFARRKYPGPSPKVIGEDTEAVIDGYTRSATTFAVYAFQLVQPEPVRLAHHLHAPAQLIEAARRGLPTMMVIRKPKGAVLSQLVREPGIDLLDALFAYRRFHESLLPYRDSFVVADYRDVTQDIGSVIRRMNSRFGTAYGVFDGSPEQRALLDRLIEQRPSLSPTLLGWESGEVSLADARHFVEQVASQSTADSDWVPSPARDAAKAALEDMWMSPKLALARSRAEQAYLTFVNATGAAEDGGLD